MRKNIFKIIAMGALATIMTATTVGCNGGGIGGKPVVDENGGDPNDTRTAMYISMFEGGYGRAWLDRIVNEYNAAHPENSYKISVLASKDEFETLQSRVLSGTLGCDMFITNLWIHKLISAGAVEDISSVWTSDPDNNGSTIESIMYNATDYKAAYGDGKGGLYALPLQESLQGFVYDHDLFLTYRLLFNEDGNFITSSTETLSKGKDGVAGTYDDGHPETEAQWKLMCDKAKAMFGYAITYSGKFQVYLNNLFYQIYAQVDGVDAFSMNYDFDGVYDFDGDGPEAATTIDMTNGYLLPNMRGSKKALEFLDTYTAAKDATLGVTANYIDPRAGNLGYSHTDAQNDYLIDNATGSSKKSAMIWEGDWWETEAKTTFDALVEENEDYEFRTRNYKFMTLPRFDNQVAKGNVYNIADNMYVSVVKQTDSTKRDICLDFLKWMHKDEYIQDFTVQGGGLRPFDVELTAEQKAKLSPFTQNYLEIYKDKNNNEFINFNLACNIYPQKKCEGFAAPIMASSSNYTINSYLYYKSAAQTTQDLLSYHQSRWAGGLTSYNNYINK